MGKRWLWSTEMMRMVRFAKTCVVLEIIKVVWKKCFLWVRCTRSAEQKERWVLEVYGFRECIWYERVGRKSQCAVNNFNVGNTACVVVESNVTEGFQRYDGRGSLVYCRGVLRKSNANVLNRELQLFGLNVQRRQRNRDFCRQTARKNCSNVSEFCKVSEQM